MRIPITGAIALVAVSRMAVGGEGATMSGIDPMNTFLRLLSDFGALGAFVIFLITDRKKEREKRDEDSRRWHALDREFVALVEKNTHVIAECTVIIRELRKDVLRAMKGERGPSGETDVEILPRTRNPEYRRREHSE